MHARKVSCGGDEKQLLANAWWLDPVLSQGWILLDRVKGPGEEALTRYTPLGKQTWLAGKSDIEIDGFPELSQGSL